MTPFWILDFGFSIRSSTSKTVLCLALWALLFALCGIAAPQQPQAKIHRVGFLSGASFASTQARIEAFRQGLRALAYAEGKNLIIEWRFARGKL